MSAGKVVILVFGIILLLISLVFLLPGGALMWADKAFRDDEGFYSTKTVELERDSYAIVTEPANIDLGGDWERLPWRGRWDPSDFLTLKIEGSSNDFSKQIFIGVAKVRDLEAYLKDVEYDEITDFKLRRFRLDYTRHPGTSEPLAPTSQTFWEASAHGVGTQTLEWELESGTYSFVLMNGDGSRALNLNVLVGVKVPPILWGIGVGLLAGAVVLLSVAILMIYLAVRKRTP